MVNSNVKCVNAASAFSGPGGGPEGRGELHQRCHHLTVVSDKAGGARRKVLGGPGRAVVPEEPVGVGLARRP